MVIQKTNPKVLPRRTSIFGFTLVELIVVITILAILGTIGFLSIGGYSSKARDSARISDVASISKSLDLSIVTVGSYPTPDSFFSVTYSGGVIWNQGVVGSNVLQAMRSSISGGGLSKKPVDPLDNTEYVYSSLAFGKAYQIKVNYEGDLNQTAMILPSVTSSLGGIGLRLASSISGDFSKSLTSNFVPEALAAPGSPTIAYIRGNYGGLTAKTVTEGITYILAVPSIITTLTGSTTKEVGVGNALSGTLLFTGKSLVNASSFNPKTVVYSGTGSPTGTALITSLQNAYSGATDIKSNSSIATLLSTTGATAIEALGGSIVREQLGGVVVSSLGSSLTVVISTKFPGEDGIIGTGDDCNTDNITLTNGQVWSACNLGANTSFNGSNQGVYNGNGSQTRGGNDSINGKLYQWGRNKGFAGSDTSQHSQLSVNPNTDDTFNFVWNSGLTNSDWINPQIPTIWGGGIGDTSTFDSQNNKILRRGPCPSGWHIPSAKDWQDACNSIANTTCSNGISNTSLRSILLLPYAGHRKWNNGLYGDQSNSGYYWASSPNGSNSFSLYFTSTNVWPASLNSRGPGFSLRCIKD